MENLLTVWKEPSQPWSPIKSCETAPIICLWPEFCLYIKNFLMGIGSFTNFQNYIYQSVKYFFLIKIFSGCLNRWQDYSKFCINKIKKSEIHNPIQVLIRRYHFQQKYLNWYSYFSHLAELIPKTSFPHTWSLTPTVFPESYRIHLQSE